MTIFSWSTFYKVFTWLPVEHLVWRCDNVFSYHLKRLLRVCFSRTESKKKLCTLFQYVKLWIDKKKMDYFSAKRVGLCLILCLILFSYGFHSSTKTSLDFEKYRANNLIFNCINTIVYL